MSGLETAIRSALDRSDRADGDTRSRIYHSARQALEAGLRKQGITDRLVIMQQHKRLEEKIAEIENEELVRVSAVPTPEPELEPEQLLPFEAVSVDPPRSDQNRPSASTGDMILQGETRDLGRSSTSPDMPGDATVDAGSLAASRPQRGEAPPLPAAAKTRRAKKTGAEGTLDVPTARAAKPRKRRGFVSHLMTWLVTLAIVAGGCWWFYTSGMVQTFVEEAVRAGDQALGGQGRGGSFDPRRGFSDEWKEVFSPTKGTALKAGPQARAEIVSASEGQAARVVSATSGEAGDVTIDVPPETLREMAGKSSTIALTLQSGADRSVQLSVRCAFGSLGNCNRHRFTATQEKLDVLFRVTFERSLAPNTPGKIILNSGIEGADRPVLIYSIRILPGQ